MVFVALPTHGDYTMVAAATSTHINWIKSLQANVPVVNSLASEILAAWPAALRSFVVSDLRAGLSGKRTHIWEAANCLVAYHITPNPATLDLMGFHQMNDETLIRFTAVLNQFASGATFIPCPQVSGTCFKGYTDASKVITNTPTTWAVRKPSLNIAMMNFSSPLPLIAPASPSASSYIGSDDSVSSPSSSTMSDFSAPSLYATRRGPSSPSKNHPILFEQSTASADDYRQAYYRDISPTPSFESLCSSPKLYSAPRRLPRAPRKAAPMHVETLVLNPGDVRTRKPSPYPVSIGPYSPSWAINVTLPSFNEDEETDDEDEKYSVITRDDTGFKKAKMLHRLAAVTKVLKRMNKAALSRFRI